MTTIVFPSKKSKNHMLSARPNLQDVAYSVLHVAICAGDLAPGSEMSESQLAESFGLTKAPLRSALARLVHGGWLTVSPRRGYVIRPITVRDTKDIFGLRKMVEPQATFIAAGKRDKKQLLQLIDKCAEAAAESTPSGESAHDFFAANKAFHVGIAQATGNARLVELVARLHEESERILHFGMNHLDWSLDWHHGHQEIVDALIREDGRLAESIALRQLVKSEEVVIEALMQSMADTPVTSVTNGSSRNRVGQVTR